MGFIGDLFSSIFGNDDPQVVQYDNNAAQANIRLNAQMQSELAQQDKQNQMELFAQRAAMAQSQLENEQYLATLEEKTQQDLEAMLSGISEGVTDDEQAQFTSIDFGNFFAAAQAVPGNATGQTQPPTGGGLTGPNNEPGMGYNSNVRPV